MAIKIVLNQFENPKLSEQIFVGKGDSVFASQSAEEYDFTVGREYEIQGISPYGYLIMKNDKGVKDEYSVEYFQKTKPLILT